MESKGCIQDCLLVREAQGGNQAASEQLVRTHDQAVLGLALRITGSGSDGQDIHQEAFLKAYKNLAGFRFECAFSTWIWSDSCCAPRIKCTHYTGSLDSSLVCHPRLGSASRRRSPLSRDCLYGFDSSAGGPSKPHCHQPLKRLTRRERMVFELKHFQGLKVRTVGEILNSSEGVVRNSLFRATQKLRFHLAMYTNGNNSSIKQRSVNGVNQAAILRQEKTLATTSTPTLNSSITELWHATVNRIVLRETFQRLFSSQGCEVDVVPDGAGLEMLSQRAFSAVILGLQHTETARM
jgi:RNA polymerase sigma-70 factor, ECF subfamily